MGETGGGTSGRLDGHLDRLEILFAAAVEAEEEIAAEDLARSLEMDLSMTEVIAHSGGAVSDSDGTLWPIDRVGSDYCAARGSDCLFPIDRAVVRLDEIGPPRASGSLLDLLRIHARAGSAVVVDTDSRSVAGVLASAGRDHVVLEGHGARWAVALDAIRSIRLGRGG